MRHCWQATASITGMVSDEGMTNTWNDGEAKAHYLYLPAPLNPLLFTMRTAQEMSTERTVMYGTILVKQRRQIMAEQVSGHLR